MDGTRPHRNRYAILRPLRQDLGLGFGESGIGGYHNQGCVCTRYRGESRETPPGITLHEPGAVFGPCSGQYRTIRRQDITWTKDGQTQHLKLLPGRIYIHPSGYKVRMEKHHSAPSWRLVGTVPEGALCHKPCTVSGGGKSAGYGEFFEAAMKQAVPEAVTLKDPGSFRLIGKPTGLVVARAKSTGGQAYGMDIELPGMVVAVIQRPPVFNGKIAKLDSAEALKVKGVKAVLPITLDRGGQGVAVVASGYWAAKKGRDALKVD